MHSFAGVQACSSPASSSLFRPLPSISAFRAKNLSPPYLPSPFSSSSSSSAFSCPPSSVSTSTASNLFAIHSLSPSTSVASLHSSSSLSRLSFCKSLSSSLSSAESSSYSSCPSLPSSQSQSLRLFSAETSSYSSLSSSQSLSSSPSSGFFVSSRGILFGRGGSRRQRVCLVLNSGIEKGRGRDVRGFASRKDRREEEASFEPDIASLKSGFAKKFPEEEFSYALDSDGEDDGADVKVTSFRSGNFGRARASPSASYSTGRDGHSLRTGSRPSGSSVERDAYERRRGQENGGYGRDSDRERGGRSYGETRRYDSASRNEREGADGGRRSYGETRGYDSGSRNYGERADGGRRSYGETRGYDSGSRNGRGDGDGAGRGYDSPSSRTGRELSGEGARRGSGETRGYDSSASRSGRQLSGEGARRGSEGARGYDSSSSQNGRDLSGEGVRRGTGQARGNDSASRNDRNSRSQAPWGGAKAAVSTGKVRKGKEPYGGGEWSKDTPVFEEAEKKKPVIEPVHFTSPMSKAPHVAILGGGMSGLMCALTLEEHGIQSTVFDTGKHGLGGRMATRYVEEHEGEKLVFDHAAQFFTVTDARFQKQVDSWISGGAVKEWSGNIGTLQAGGEYTELPHATRYIGMNGMRSLADQMLSQSRQVNVKRPCWISNMEAADGTWKLFENRRSQGEFDVVVIAHNGKCANRLLSTANVRDIARQMKRLDLSSIWALLAAFNEPVPTPGKKNLDGAFVEGVNALSWMGNNSNKLVLPGAKIPECWTFFSTAAYGKKHKVPQESIPAVKAERVKEDMLHAVEVALGLPEDSLPTPIYTRVQLWGAALPTNTPGVPCIFDSQGRVGICGDWLLGSSLEAAALSGMALADHIASYKEHGGEVGKEFNIGLQETFSAVKGKDIGQFPDESAKASPQEVLAVV